MITPQKLANPARDNASAFSMATQSQLIDCFSSHNIPDFYQQIFINSIRPLPKAEAEMAMQNQIKNIESSSSFIQAFMRHVVDKNRIENYIRTNMNPEAEQKKIDILRWCELVGKLRKLNFKSTYFLAKIRDKYENCSTYSQNSKKYYSQFASKLDNFRRELQRSELGGYLEFENNYDPFYIHSKQKENHRNQRCNQALQDLLQFTVEESYELLKMKKLLLNWIHEDHETQNEHREGKIVERLRLPEIKANQMAERETPSRFEKGEFLYRKQGKKSQERFSNIKKEDINKTRYNRGFYHKPSKQTYWKFDKADSELSNQSGHEEGPLYFSRFQKRGEIQAEGYRMNFASEPRQFIGKIRRLYTQDDRKHMINYNRSESTSHLIVEIGDNTKSNYHSPVVSNKFHQRKHNRIGSIKLQEQFKSKIEGKTRLNPKLQSKNLINIEILHLSSPVQAIKSIKYSTPKEDNHTFEAATPQRKTERLEENPQRSFDNKNESPSMQSRTQPLKQAISPHASPKDFQQSYKAKSNIQASAALNQPNQSQINSKKEYVQVHPQQERKKYKEESKSIQNRSLSKQNQYQIPNKKLSSQPSSQIDLHQINEKNEKISQKQQQDKNQESEVPTYQKNSSFSLKNSYKQSQKKERSVQASNNKTPSIGNSQDRVIQGVPVQSEQPINKSISQKSKSSEVEIIMSNSKSDEKTIYKQSSRQLLGSYSQPYPTSQSSKVNISDHSTPLVASQKAQKESHQANVLCEPISQGNSESIDQESSATRRIMENSIGERQKQSYQQSNPKPLQNNISSSGQNEKSVHLSPQNPKAKEELHESKPLEVAGAKTPLKKQVQEQYSIPNKLKSIQTQSIISRSSFQEDKRQIKLKAGKFTLQQFKEYLKQYQIHPKYVSLYDMDKVIKQTEVEQSYLSQFTINNIPTALALSSVTPNNNFIIRLWILSRNAEESFAPALFKKYAGYVQKLITNENIYFRGPELNQVLKAGFSLKKGNVYFRERTTKPRVIDSQFEPFVSLECSNIVFVQKQKEDLLYSEDIQNFTLNNSMAADFLFEMDSNEVPEPLKGLVKVDNELPNLPALNNVLTKSNFDNYEINSKIVAHDIDVSRIQFPSQFKDLFVATDGVFKFYGNLVMMNESKAICSIKLTRHNGRVCFAKGFKSLDQVQKNLKVQSQTKVAFSVPMFNKKLYGRYKRIEAENDEAFYCNWDFTCYWQDEMQGLIRNSSQQKMNFCQSPFFVSIQAQGTLLFLFSVNKNDFIFGN